MTANNAHQIMAIMIHLSLSERYINYYSHRQRPALPPTRCDRQIQTLYASQKFTTKTKAGRRLGRSRYSPTSRRRPSRAPRRTPRPRPPRSSSLRAGLREQGAASAPRAWRGPRGRRRCGGRSGASADHAEVSVDEIHVDTMVFQHGTLTMREGKRSNI